MIDSVSSTTSSTTSTSSSSSASSSLSANYDMFLQLLCTQLQTQSPLDPMDTSEFTSQLATYAGLEQQISANDKLDELVSGINSLSLSSGVGYLGHTVEADTDTLSVGADGSVDASWQYTLASDAGAVTLSVVDSAGETVWTGSGETASGSHTFSWDGTDANGDAVDPGDYTLQVSATTASGTAITSSIAIRGTVTAIDSSSGSTMVELGGTQVDLSAVTRLAS